METLTSTDRPRCDDCQLHSCISFPYIGNRELKYLRRKGQNNGAFVVKMDSPHRDIKTSLFLTLLPLEIRILIYEHALLSAQPLDLWPQQWYDETNLNTIGNRNIQQPFKVRRQDSLLFIRKELATGLLGTCDQIYNEASCYFWSKNHWRFSGRSGWQGLLRFFLTIGRRARSRIQKLDVHAPIYMRWDNRTSFGFLDGRSKNHPKMHMARIEAEGHLDNQTIQAVCGIIQQDRTLLELNFVVPEDFRNGDEDSFGGYDMNHEGGTGALRCIQKLDFVNKTVVFEEKSYLAVKKGVEGILQQGWNLSCMPGSFIYEISEDGDFQKTWVHEKRRWNARDYVHGFDEPLQTNNKLPVLDD